MLFHQLKTLLWRNAILKKRGWISTILEILIPTLIILILVKNSKEIVRKEEIDTIEDVPPYMVNNSTRTSNTDIRNEYYFVFSSDFDTQKQNIFLENFKNHEYFSSFRFLDRNDNFTEDKYNDFFLNNYGELERIAFFDNETEVESKGVEFIEGEVVQECKIMGVYSDEKSLFEDLRVNAFTFDEGVIFDVYAISFKSLTEYTLFFEKRSDVELIDNLININDFYDYTDHLKAFNFQILINNVIVKSFIDPSSSLPNIDYSFKIMDRIGYIEKNKESSVLSFVPFLMLFYFVPCICSLLGILVIEKESKIKESLVIIGLNKTTFWISWAITYSIIIFITSIIASMVISHFRIFINIHWSSILVILIVFGLSCCCLSFALSTLINKSKTSHTFGAIIILSYFALYFVNKFLKEGTAKWICSFTFSPVAFLSLFDDLIKFERQKVAITCLSLLGNSILRKYFMGLVGTFFLYFLLAIYLDNVLPQGNHIHKKWHFFMTDPFRYYYHRKHRSTTNDNDGKIFFSDRSDHSDHPFIQKDPEGFKKSVEVHHIGRNFVVKGETLEILKDIHFNAYYDEIFAILGHNGAGKTTLLRIMTGVLSSTRGKIYYDDVPIHGNETEICKQFGYCPQFEAFNNNLTVGEHIKLFAGIKDITVNVDEVLRDIDLLNKKDNFPKQLSGGQRRKLCITLALLGSPKYVFLDEPTTGLDPYSRKSIWELLSRKKKGCTMFVTTHYMDEADLLADRKMIISNGNITCLGTSLFLKNSFNMNYALDVNTTNQKDSYLVDSIIERYCPGSSQTKSITLSQFNESNRNEGSGTASEVYIITYLLPMKYSNLFKDIFNSINELIKDHNNGINNFSLTSPTLEELFIRLESNEGGDNAVDKNIQKVKESANVEINSSEWSKDKDDDKLLNQLDPVFGKTNMNKSSSLRQIYSIIKIRIKMFLRNRTFALIYTLFPVCLIIACIFFENKYINSLYDNDKKFKPLEMRPTLYEDVTWFKNPTVSSGVALDIINRIETSNANKIKIESVDYDKQLTTASNNLTRDSKYIGGFAGSVGDDQSLHFTIYEDIKYNFAIPVGIDLIHNAFLEQNNVDKKISVSYCPFPRFENSDYDEDDEDKLLNILPEQMRLALEPVLSVAIAIAISLSVSIYGPMTVKEREEGMTWQLFLNGTHRINYWFGVFLGDTICILIPILLIAIAGYFNEINIFNVKVILFTAVITIAWIICSLFHQYVVSHFFKKYDRCLNLFIIINPILSLFVGIYCLIVTIISSIFIDENQDDSSSSKNTFDDSTTTKDGSSSSQSDSKAQYIQYIFYAVMILYAPALIVLGYSKLAIFIGNAKLKIDSANIFAFVQSSEFQKIMSDTTLNKVEKNKRIAQAFFNLNFPTLTDVVKSKDIRMTVEFILVLLLVYVIILYVKEKAQKKLLKCDAKLSNREKEAKDKKLREGPVDVYNEFKKVEQSLEDNKNGVALKVYRLNKDYSMSLTEVNRRRRKREKENKKRNKKNGSGREREENENDKMVSAFERMDNRVIFDKTKRSYINRIVDDVTFGVSNGQCLGLLGPNGAGKTTSINMITGLISRTHGKVVYGNKDLNTTDLSKLSLGYCSQHDSLWKLLTVKETIQFYLNICGYPHKDIPRYTKALIEACGIENHTNKRVSEISGGTKRKLSLIIAICSSPSYLILDEPSAGMDPFTRRYMWKLISELKKVRETATILTTHSTEEAEALCDRIAILIKGNLVCIDTPRSIKMNQSHRYVLEVFTDHPEEFEEKYVKGDNLFGLKDDEHYDLESSFTYQKYSVEMKTENIANVFAIMESAKESGVISQYNFGQYSLEQVFIDFVNNAE